MVSRAYQGEAPPKCIYVMEVVEAGHDIGRQMQHMVVSIQDSSDRIQGAFDTVQWARTVCKIATFNLQLLTVKRVLTTKVCPSHAAVRLVSHASCTMQLLS